MQLEQGLTLLAVQALLPCIFGILAQGRQHLRRADDIAGTAPQTRGSWFGRGAPSHWREGRRFTHGRCATLKLPSSICGSHHKAHLDTSITRTICAAIASLMHLLQHWSHVLRRDRPRRYSCRVSAYRHNISASSRSRKEHAQLRVRP